MSPISKSTDEFCLSFLKLPGEIRNHIYQLVLEAYRECVTVLLQHDEPVSQRSGFNLLCTYLQVYKEACLLLGATKTLYLPVYTYHRFRVVLLFRLRFQYVYTIAINRLEHIKAVEAGHMHFVNAHIFMSDIFGTVDTAYELLGRPHIFPLLICKPLRNS